MLTHPKLSHAELVGDLKLRDKRWHLMRRQEVVDADIDKLMSLEPVGHTENREHVTCLSHGCNNNLTKP